MKHWNLDIIGYWVIGQVPKWKRTWNLAPVLQIVQKITEIIIYPCLHLSIGQVWWLHELWFKIVIYSKMYLVSYTNTHCDNTDSVKHGMVKNIETWISWEQNIIFLQYKKILQLCLTWHILRNYHLVAEVTFKSKQKKFEKRLW